MAPPALAPQPPPQLVPQAPVVAAGRAVASSSFPEVPVVPEADSLVLVLGGLAAVGGLAAYQRRRQPTGAS
jgi:hypothetical protein